MELIWVQFSFLFIDVSLKPCELKVPGNVNIVGLFGSIACCANTSPVRSIAHLSREIIFNRFPPFLHICMEPKSNDAELRFVATDGRVRFVPTV